MNNKKNFPALTALAFAAALTLAACGGGGGSSGGGGSNNSASGSGTGTTTSPTVTGTQSTAQYPANSAQQAAFTLLNQYRQQCGFAAFQENTVLDVAANNHSKWEGLNNTVSDSEQSGQPGFTGADYATRATYAGFPGSVYLTGASGAGQSVFSTSFVAATAGQQFVYGLLGGAYHAVVAAYPANIVGFGEYETQATAGSYTYTNSWQSISFASTQTQTLSNAPLTFPCQGVTGLPYREVAEIPTAPNASASGTGTPVVVMGNATDTIVLQSATMTDTTGNTVTLQLLNSATDPNKLVSTHEAVAYPTSPLSPNTTYTVSLAGTYNGAAFSRSFSFTTGNVIG
ncbi:CAP domain-containing protein [Paraburkholderia sp. A2WS-5]|uniref:CAP domain-containing protein n=1 Tax=unclassified Paraburkholderia TaxID=2615204 RepID=UPI003B7893D5